MRVHWNKLRSCRNVSQAENNNESHKCKLRVYYTYTKQRIFGVQMNGLMVVSLSLCKLCHFESFFFFHYHSQRRHQKNLLFHGRSIPAYFTYTLQNDSGGKSKEKAIRNALRKEGCTLRVMRYFFSEISTKIKFKNLCRTASTLAVIMTAFSF